MSFPFEENLTRLIVGVNGIIPLQRLYDDVSGSIVKVPVCAAQCYSSGDLKITMLELHYQTSRVLWSTTDGITVTSAFTKVIATKGKMREVSVLAG